FREHSFVAKPYQDVSVRIRGPILEDINHNFCQAWETSHPADSAFIVVNNVNQFAKMLSSWPAGHWTLIQKCTHSLEDNVQEKAYGPNKDFIARRSLLKGEAFKLKDGKHNAQLMRTQPMYGEKDIKECYANLTRLATRYIFIQNQYIQYIDWAEHLKEQVSNL